jgi:uncharacterized membrane protein (DUF485 family)
MIGKPEWFSPRKFGWGLGVRTREGGLYISIVVFLLGFLTAVIVRTNMLALGVVFAVLLADMLHIMTQVYSKLDEREARHQALAERNASFTAVACILVYVLYTVFTAFPAMKADPWTLIGALGLPVGLLLLMSAVKGVTLLYLERES